MQGAQCKGIMSSLQYNTAQQFIYGEWCFYAILFVNPAADKHEKNYWNLWTKFLFFYDSVQLCQGSLWMYCLTDGDFTFLLLWLLIAFLLPPDTCYALVWACFLLKASHLCTRTEASGLTQGTSAPPPNITCLVELLGAHSHPRPASHV